MKKQLANLLKSDVSWLMSRFCLEKFLETTDVISRIKNFKNALNYDRMNCIEIILRRNDLMSTSFENKATNRGVITFTIGQDKIKPALDQAFNKIKKT